MADSDKAEALVIIRDFAKLGFALYATHGTAKFLAENGLEVTAVNKISEGSPNLLELIHSGKVSLLINTLSKDRKVEIEAQQIRRASVEHAIPCLTSLDTARALHYALTARHEGEEFEVVPINEYVQGSVLGPTVWLSLPSITAPPATNPQVAKAVFLLTRATTSGAGQSRA